MPMPYPAENPGAAFRVDVVTEPPIPFVGDVFAPEFANERDCWDIVSEKGEAALAIVVRSFDYDRVFGRLDKNHKAPGSLHIREGEPGLAEQQAAYIDAPEMELAKQRTAKSNHQQAMAGSHDTPSTQLACPECGGHNAVIHRLKLLSRHLGFLAQTETVNETYDDNPARLATIRQALDEAVMGPADFFTRFVLQANQAHRPPSN